MESLDRTGAMRRLTLAPFDLAGTAALVGRALGTRRGTTPFVKRLWAETGGNALFLIEMLAALIEQGALRRTADGRWQFPSESAPWPTLRSLQGIVDYRAAQLEPEARALLEALAVLGGEADFPTILQLAEDRQRLLPCLERLKQLGFLRDTETHYCFVHDRIREGLYRAIPAERRRSLHRRVGEVLTALHPQRLDALAHHFEEAGLWDAAVRHHLEAGAQAERMHAPHAAWEHYSRALTLLEEKRPFPAREAAEIAFRAHAARRELSWMLGRTEAEEADIAALLRLADRLLDPVRRAEALNQHAYFLCNTRDDYAAAIRQAEAALEVAEAHDLPEAAARAWRNLGEAIHRHGDYRRAETALQRSLEVWASLGGHERELGETQIYLAQVYEQTGEIDASERYGREAVEAAKRADAPLTLARAYALLARLAYRRADHHACLRYHEASLEQIRRIGHKQNEAVELSNLGLVYWTLRDYGRAVALMEEGLAVYRSMGNRRGIVGAMDNLSGLYLETGRFEEAHAALDEGLQIARDIGFQHTEALLWVTLARLYLDEGRLEEAERALQEAQQIAARLDAPYVGGTVHLGLGLWAWARGEVAEADHHFAQALADYEAAGETDFAIAARAFLARGCAALGSLEEALQLSDEAITALEATPGGEFIQESYLHRWEILRLAGREAEAVEALEKAWRSVQAQATTLPDEAWRRAFLTRVPSNRRIVEAWEASQPKRITCQLPHLEAPTGRPLRPDEFVPVLWTVAAPEDEQVQGKVARRRHRLRRLLPGGGRLAGRSAHRGGTGRRP